MFAVLSLSLGWTLSLCFLVSATEVLNKTAEPGDNVILPCEVPSNTNTVVVKWTRPELEPEYVCLYRNKEPVPDDQHPSLKNRVELEDREMKHGNVSVILKNVTGNDAGTYECKIIQRGTGSRRKRAAYTQTIKIIYLDVHQKGPTAGHREEGGDKMEGGKDEGKKDGGNMDGKSRESGGLVAGLSVFAVCVFLISGILVNSKMHMKKNPPLQASPEEKCELQLE